MKLKIKNLKLKIMREQKGVALLWALITIAVLLGITGSMAGLIVKESQMASGIDSSVGAYAAAESGIEHGSFLLSDNNLTAAEQAICPSGSTPCQIDTNLTYNIDFAGSAGNWKIASTGKSGNTTRKIEKGISTAAASQPFVRTYDSNPGLDSNSEHSISWLDNVPSPPGNRLDAPNINIENGVNGSYTQLFRIEPGILADQFFAIGLAESYDTANPKKIMLVRKASGSGVEGGTGIFVGNKTETPYTDSTTYTLGGETYVPLQSTKAYYIEISYIKNVAIQVRIKESDKDGPCVAVISIPVSGDFRFWKVRFEGTASWQNPTVNTAGDVAKVLYMGIKAPTVTDTSSPYYNSYPPDPQPPFTISSISPNPANIGQSVTINATTGTSFGGQGSVTFGGTAATITSWTSNQIIVTVPDATPPWPGGIVTLTVVDVDENSGSASFTYNLPVNGAASFDGVDDYIDFGDINATEGISAFTVEFWMKADASQKSWNGPFGKGEAYGTNSSWYFYMTGTNNLAFMVVNSSKDYAWTQAPNVFDGNWHHIAGTYNGSTVSVYKDGILQTSGSLTGGIQNTTLKVLAGTYEWAAGNGNFTSAAYKGLLDEVRLSRVARYSGGSFSLTNKAFAGDVNTIALWHFDGNANDSSGNGYNGTLRNGPTWGTGVVTY